MRKKFMIAEQLQKIWKLIPLGVLFFFFFTILKSLTLSLSNCIAFSIATILLLLIPHLLKKTKLKEKINQWSPQTIKVLFRFLLLVHLIFMVLFSLLFISEPRNDLGTIYHSALEIVENGKINTEIDENTSCYHFYGYSNNDYFNNCQNNIMLLLILTLLYKVMSLLGFALTLEGTLLISQFFNILCIELAIWIGLKILQKKEDPFTSFIYFILSFFFLPYFINAFRFYTDTIVLPFSMLLIYLFISIDEQKDNQKKRIFSWIGMGLLAFLAIQIKQSAGIIVVAMFLFLLFQKRKRDLLHFCTILLPILFLLMALFQFWIHHTSWIDMSREEWIKFPTAHWISLGMTKSGSYNQDLVNLLLEHETTVEQKEQIVLQVLKQQLDSYESMGDFLDFEFEKAVTTWCSGTYYQNSHLTWFYTPNIFQEFLLSDGKYFETFSIVLKTYSFFLLVCFLQISIQQLKEKNCPNHVFYSLIILGLALFLSFWETKSRYLLSFVPIFLLLVSDHLAKMDRE